MWPASEDHRGQDAADRQRREWRAGFYRRTHGKYQEERADQLDKILTHFDTPGGRAGDVDDSLSPFAPLR
jgi:hypothetical protein